MDWERMLEELQTAGPRQPDPAAAALRRYDLAKVKRRVDVGRTGKVNYIEFIASTMDHNVYTQGNLCSHVFLLLAGGENGSCSLKDLDQARITPRSLKAALGGDMSEREYEELLQEAVALDAEAGHTLRCSVGTGRRPIRQL